MATYKRRIVYLTDEQWAAIKERADKEGLSISSYIRLSVAATGGALRPDIQEIERQTYVPLAPSVFVPASTFTPVPKPAPKKKPGKRY